MNGALPPIEVSIDGGAEIWAALMESVHRWAASDGYAIEPYGLSDELVAAGYVIDGRREWPKPTDPRVVRRVCWIDRP